MKKKKQKEFNALLIQMGENIKAIREDKGIKQYQLAQDTDMEKANMSRIEAGKTNASLLTLYKISEALDVHITELLK